MLHFALCLALASDLQPDLARAELRAGDRRLAPLRVLPALGPDEATKQETETPLEGRDWLKREQLEFVAQVAVGDLHVLLGVREDGSLVLAGFTAGADEPRWTQRLQASGPAEEPNAVLWAARQPGSIGAAITPLTRQGERVLVQNGERGPLVAFYAPDGQFVAQLDRPWEFERGFTGPSVWSHHMELFGGVDPGNADAPQNGSAIDSANLDAVRARFDFHTLGWVIAGPCVLSPDRSYIAVALASRGPWAAQRARTRLLELDSVLNPIGLLDLSAAPLELIAHPVAGICARLEGPAWISVRPTAESEERSHGPFSWNRVLDLRWLRSTRTVAPEAWLVTEAAFRGHVRLGDWVVDTSVGGYVNNEGEHVMHFPLTALDLRNGTLRELLLKVPFAGTLPRPDTNYVGTLSGLRTFWPHGLALTLLEPAGEHVLFRLDSEGGRHRAVFDLREFLR